LNSADDLSLLAIPCLKITLCLWFSDREFLLLTCFFGREIVFSGQRADFSFLLISHQKYSVFCVFSINHGNDHLAIIEALIVFMEELSRCGSFPQVW
jgi:hypothetical protein